MLSVPRVIVRDAILQKMQGVQGHLHPGSRGGAGLCRVRGGLLASGEHLRHRGHPGAQAGQHAQRQIPELLCGRGGKA